MLSLGFHPDCVPYERALELQAEAVDRIEQGLDRGTVLLLEHPPVYTAGRRAEPDEYPSDGSPVVAVDRGGRVTWHGPGQLVCYPVVRLRSGAGVSSHRCGSASRDGRVHSGSRTAVPRGSWRP